TPSGNVAGDPPVSGQPQHRPPASTPARVTIGALTRRTTPFACLTCYDATTAAWLTRAGVHVLLVGDTAAEMTLGFTRTLDMPLDVLLALTAGVKRGSERAASTNSVAQPLIMGDMPFMSYHASPDDAVRNAGRFLTEGLADVVKLEVDASFAPLVERLTRAGVPVCAHIGSRPQRFMLTGGYSAAGRTPEEAARIVADAQAMQDAGAPMLLLEAVPQSTADAVLEVARVPVIGIGAGAGCHGQVLVLNDLLGLTEKPPPFVKAITQVGAMIEAAGRQWVGTVERREVGESPYSMRPAAER
ncbi:MAG: 3-methyl-2-oxobutanoate hydroxymethyltransferase, partial [Phycisphaerales bacterium]|nr:3-methyl-2-oxobutanoate hydroxymethyltransferase [Phycisphaerales bacterium]